jgi:putative PIN family toxin of toxin-antitoxin system
VTLGQVGVPRLVVDPGVYVSAAISGRGLPGQLLDLAIEGQVVLLISPLVVAELREVLSREKFRRYITQMEVEAFLEALTVLAEQVDDPVRESQVPISRDPDDDYLVVLTEATGATFLVSGDRDLLDLDRPGLDVRSPRDAVDAIVYRHPWGRSLVPGDEAVAYSQARIEGHDNVLQTAEFFLAVMGDENALELLPHIVTPESEAAWIADLARVREMTSDRGIGSRAEYPSPDVAYVKLPPDPGETVKATGHVLLEGVIILTLQRRPELPDALGLGGWRVHGVGGYVRPEDMPTESHQPE